MKESKSNGSLGLLWYLSMTKWVKLHGYMLFFTKKVHFFKFSPDYTVVLVFHNF